MVAGNVENKNKIKLKMPRINYVSYRTYHSTEARERVSKEFFFSIFLEYLLFCSIFSFLYMGSQVTVCTKNNIRRRKRSLMHEITFEHCESRKCVLQGGSTSLNQWLWNTFSHTSVKVWKHWYVVCRSRRSSHLFLIKVTLKQFLCTFETTFS